MYKDISVTDVNNMLNLLAARSQTPPQVVAGGQKTPLLSDFVGLLLAPQGAAPDAAMLQNMPENLKALAEKIAAMLQTPSPATGDAAVTTAGDTAVPATLTQDLSAMLAGMLQDADGAPALPEADMQTLAGLLNNIEPGAAEAAQASTGINARAAQAPQESSEALLLLQMTQAQAQTQTQTRGGETEAGQPKALTQTHNHIQPQMQNAAQQNTAAQMPIQNSAPQNALKAETALQAMMSAQQPATAGGGFDGSAGGFGQQNGFAGGFTGGGDAFGGLTLQTNGPAFAQYMNTGAMPQTLPAHTSQMIAVQIQRNAAAKIDTFTLQLDPADLGRMDIELKFSHDGRLKAHLTVERPETLALLQKDAAHLERVLQQNGLQTDGQSLSFDLRQQGRGDDRREMQTGDTGKPLGNVTGRADGLHGDNDNNGDVLRGYIGPRGVNIMV